MSEYLLMTEDQRELVAMVRKFLSKELTPMIQECDENSRYPMEIHNKLGEMGFFAMDIPEEYGGAGFDAATISHIREALGYADAGFACSFSASTFGIKPVLLVGTEEQKHYYAEKLAAGKMSAMCMTETQSGSDLGRTLTKAVRDGDDFIINGTKCFITNGGVADLYVVFATMDRALGAKGISAFIVERNRPGVSSGKEEDKMGIRLSNTCDVIFEDVHIPASNLLSKEGYGFPLLMDTLNRTRAVGGASAVGICQRALDLSIAYAKERKTFGKPIAANQAIQFMLADMEILTQAARHLAWTGARALDMGVADAGFGAVAKTFCSDAAMKITTDAVQIFGGYGYSREYPVEKLMRDAKIFQIFEGTNQIQRIVIAGSLLK